VQGSLQEEEAAAAEAVPYAHAEVLVFPSLKGDVEVVGCVEGGRNEEGSP
jgi:hypothetical protein